VPVLSRNHGGRCPFVEINHPLGTGITAPGSTIAMIDDERQTVHISDGFKLASQFQ
jgi:hypothetical protein